MLKSGVFIVAAKRTPFGAFGGSLKNFSATDMAEIASRAALKSARALIPEHVDHIIFGNAINTNKDSIYLARHVGLRINVPNTTPAYTVNRLCASSFQSIINAAHQIITGDSEIVLAGGSEAMSQAPFIIRNIRFGVGLSTEKFELEDSLWSSSIDYHINLSMGNTAELLGAKYNITRESSDEYAYKSQLRWHLANNAGYFKDEIETIKIKSKKKEIVFNKDEHPRETTIENLNKLPSFFQKNGLVTSGNSSGVCDGAAALILASENVCKRENLTPLARLVGWNITGCDPKMMGLGPVQSIKGLLKKTNVNMDQVEAIEINEAFACQILAVKKELNLEDDRLNLNGGSIAMGHPLGASGARIAAHLSHEIKRRGIRYGIGSACIGGGQGIAILLEKV